MRNPTDKLFNWPNEEEHDRFSSKAYYWPKKYLVWASCLEIVWKCMARPHVWSALCFAFSFGQFCHFWCGNMKNSNHLYKYLPSVYYLWVSIKLGSSCHKQYFTVNTDLDKRLELCLNSRRILQLTDFKPSSHFNRLQSSPTQDQQTSVSSNGI